MSPTEPHHPICVSRLRCEYLVNPVGIDEIHPRLSWIIEGDRRGARQIAWQVRVASSGEQLEQGQADLWDSGRVGNDQSTHIVYDGVPLQSRMTCHWRVTVWDESGEAITSEPACWTMGLLKPGDWRAKWITHDPEIIRRDPEAIVGTKTTPGSIPLFRKTFTLPTNVCRATLYVTARGLVDLQLNGRRVSEDQFMPEWTDYNKRLHYRTFDVTSLLVPGENVLGAMLGDGWWSGFIGWQETRGHYGTLQNSLLVQLEVEAGLGEAVSGSADSPINQNGSFPLTPALSPGEREEGKAATGPSALASQTNAQLPVPSPGGEGQGEGKGAVSSSMDAPLTEKPPVGMMLMISDSTWRCETGPILSSDFMMGEVYDARRERAGWDQPGFEDSTWLPAIEVAASKIHIPWFGFSNNQPGDTEHDLPLVAQRSEPVRVIETLQPVSVNEIKPGVFIYDFGQNFAGWVRLKVNGDAGTRVRIRHGERLNPDGTLYTENLRRARATDVYILKGGGEETWEPRFTFHGFQYVELTGLTSPLPLEQPGRRDSVEKGSAAVPAAPVGVSPTGLQSNKKSPGSQVQRCSSVSGETPATARGTRALPIPNACFRLSGRVVMSSTPPAGEFECSHPLVNRLWKNVLWGQKSNFLTVPTDCPQRDERLGWMGDAQVFLRTATCNMDVAAFFTKWMNDVTDSQDVDGVFPDVAPRMREDGDFVGLDGLGGAAGWADAGIIVPWTIWRVYGDRRIIERHWESMVRWLDWLERTNPDGIRRQALNNNYGDWLCIPSDTSFRTQSPMKTLLATAYWADDAAKMARMAHELGKAQEETRFGAMHQRVRMAFQKEWLRDDGRLAVETQTAYLLALAFNLLPDESRERAAAHLVENIRQLDWHLSTGFIGISHLNPILTRTGHVDVAYRLLLNEDYPSWLYPVIHGATTIWERWNGWTREDGFFNPQMNSFNHYSLGSVGEWLFRHVAGIELDPQTPGFKRFMIRPCIGGNLTHAGARYDSIHGTIESRWRREGNRLHLKVIIPANTTARIHVPCDNGNEVTEGGKPASEANGLRSVASETGWAVFEGVSGNYEFLSTFSA